MSWNSRMLCGAGGSNPMWYSNETRFRGPSGGEETTRDAAGNMISCTVNEDCPQGDFCKIGSSGQGICKYTKVFQSDLSNLCWRLCVIPEENGGMGKDNSYCSQACLNFGRDADCGTKENFKQGKNGMQWTAVSPSTGKSIVFQLKVPKDPNTGKYMIDV